MPPSKTRRRSTRSLSIPLRLAGLGPVCCAGVVRTSSLGVPKDRPSTDVKTNRPLPAALPKMRSLRREGATPHARAAPVVSHDFDGLLRLAPCRSVAPCNRSWGSPRFRLARPRSPCTALPLCSGFPLHRVAAVLQVRVLARLPRGALPYGAFPSTPALRRVTATDTSSPLPSV
jgi:hypothetical protein